MYTEYIDLYVKYTGIYGSKTAIFLMVGSFYELYDIQNTETGDTRCNVKEIVDYLGIQLSIKKKDIDEKHDGLFAGFPDYVMHKWAGRLTSAGWTVVIVDQVKDSRGKVTERKVSRILSPSTHIEAMSSAETPYVASLYFKQNNSSPPSFGAAILDLTTGSTISYSGVTNGRADIWTADDLVQMLSVYSPKEILIYWCGETKPEDSFFKRTFTIPSTIPLFTRQIITPSLAFTKDIVRAEYLQKVYMIRSLLPPKVYLGLRTDEEELALLYLLQFAEDHIPSTLKAFNRNEPWNPNMRLICGNHALTQLQMTNINPQESVIGIFNACITPMGKRAIKERLLSPMSSAAEIRRRLEEVKEIQLWKQENIKSLEKYFRFMFDLPRLHRKILCATIPLQEIGALFQTYAAIENIMNTLTTNTILEQPYKQQEWVKYIKVFRENFSEEKAQKTSEDITPFNTEKFTEIATTEEKIKTIHKQFEELRAEFCKLGNLNVDAIRLEAREKEPFGLKGSKITLVTLKKCIPALPEGTQISELKSGGWIDCNKLQALNHQLQREREKLQNLSRTHIIEACQEIADAGITLWHLVEVWISHLDCTNCIARISREHGYTCPEISDTKEDDEFGSGFEIENIRHPLVENSSRVEYIKHNVTLGNISDDIRDDIRNDTRNDRGWLVYGMNASGKSTLMKATGICILLAQAGCFVPAKTMTLRPFKAIYTRILNQDNLFAGLSSFAVEMSELRDILRNADKYTLVLGDELCAGTESISAQALVASGIQWLSAKKAKFIFATHLHDLPNILNIDELRVKVWHLHVDYNPVTKKLIYDRTLRPGSGSSMYGLEVARAMDLPLEFIEQAVQNRHRIVGSTLISTATTSIWNESIVRKECEICHNPITSELEVHHIQQRKDAHNSILKDGTHMNSASNLIVLCEKCHDKHHRNELEISTLITTSDGAERKTVKSTNSDNSTSYPEKSRKSKWTADELDLIEKVLAEYKNSSLKSLKYHLESKYDISISEAVLGKIRRGEF